MAEALEASGGAGLLAPLEATCPTPAARRLIPSLRDGLRRESGERNGSRFVHVPDRRVRGRETARREPAYEMSVLRRVVALQQRLSFGFDRIVLPARLRTDGNTDFAASFVPPYLHAGVTVYDIGGGSTPFVTRQMKQRLGLEVVGLDIESQELARAPAGLYDRTINSDICDYPGKEEADLVICRSVLEHVRDADPPARRRRARLLSVGKRRVRTPQSVATRRVETLCAVQRLPRQA